MPTLYELHRTAVLTTVAIVDTIRPTDLIRATPCAGWTLAELLAHMTAQHHGFAAAARGHGADPATWRPDPFTVATDPVGTYADAAHDVLAAFAADGVGEAPFALPEFGPDAVVPGDTAMGFHFVDYVVHGWDVARSLAQPFSLPGDVTAAALPIVLSVPDGDFRDIAPAPFARALTPADDGDMARILRHLGREPEWRPEELTMRR